MKRITMAETRRGCEDGYHTREYHKDETYTVPDTMASHFVRQGYAVFTDPVPTIEQFIAELKALHNKRKVA